MRRIGPVLIVFAWLALGGGFVTNLAAQMRGLGRIEGTVVDQSGTPLEGVSVRAPLGGGSAMDTTTDARGRWALGGIGRGEWKIEFRKAGYSPLLVKVILERELDRVKPITVTLKK